MKITLSKAQWENIGKNIIKTAKPIEHAKPSEFQIIDMSSKRFQITTKVKKDINNEINNMPDYFDQIPLEQIKTILKKYDIILLQEDGTPWSGWLLGNAQCGTEEAKSQRAAIDLAMICGESKYLLNSMLILTWCKMSSGKYEVIKYIS